MSAPQDTPSRRTQMALLLLAAGLSAWNSVEIMRHLRRRAEDERASRSGAVPERADEVEAPAGLEARGRRPAAPGRGLGLGRRPWRRRRRGRARSAEESLPPPEGGERFDKFTERARKVLSLANEEAARFNHNYIGTEHLLLGLVREGEGIAAGVLESLGIRLRSVRAETLHTINTDAARSRPEPEAEQAEEGERFDRLTPSAREALSFANRESGRMGHTYIGTEHLLLGLVREGKGGAARVLGEQDADLSAVRAAVAHVEAAEERGPRGVLGLSPRAKLVMSATFRRAAELGQPHVGTEHILLGLVEHGEGRALEALSRLRVDLERAHERALRLAQGAG